MNKGALSVVSKVVRSSSITIKQKKKKNPQNLRCPSCKSSSVAIELNLLLPRLKSIKGNINDYIWSKRVDFHL